MEWTSKLSHSESELTPATTSYDLARPSSPTMSEKRKLEIPTIVLTEAPCTTGTRSRASLPAKQIVLLNPNAPFSHSRTSLFFASQPTRTVVLVILLALAMWHLYTTLSLNGVVHVHVPPAAMQW